MKKKLLQLLLMPVAFVTYLLTSIRRWLFNIGALRRERPEIKTIVVGNLALGGSGKTPHVLFIAELLLNENIKVAILSRGYGRKTKGFRWVSEQDKAEEVADEPLLMKRRLADVPVAVCENRKIGIEEIRSKFPDTEVVILDDGFQHLKLKAGYYILLSDFQTPFFKDLVFPSGRLRESRRNARFADLVVYSRSPSPKDFSQERMSHYHVKTKRFSHAPVLFSQMEYQKVSTEIGENKILEGTNVIAVSGLANNERFFDKIRRHYTLEKTFAFKDHHNFKLAEVNMIIAEAKKDDAPVICTEKDLVKLLPFEQLFLEAGLNLAVVKIEVVFSNKEEKILKHKLLSYAGKD